MSGRRMYRRVVCPVAVALCAAASAGAGQNLLPGPLIPRDYRVVSGVLRGGRTALHQDPIEARVVAGTWRFPAAGEAVRAPGAGTAAWTVVQAEEDGTLRQGSPRAGYAATTVVAPRDGVWLLEAAGHSLVYVNGEPRTGDPYNNDTVRLPVLLRAGANELLFASGRGTLRCRLVPAAAPALLSDRDPTLPDLRVGEPVDAWGAALVTNATTETLDGLRLRSTWPGGRTTTVSVPSLPPLTMRKVGFRLRGSAPQPAGTRNSGAEPKLEVTLLGRRGNEREAALGSTRFPLRIRLPHQSYRRTFRSDVDGSVQYYAVLPARTAGSGEPASERRARNGSSTAPALFLSLHGAGVEAIGQADAYSPKSWGHIVAPTNRRPFGFDWEDWGRWDALEVLEHAQRELRTDPRRTYLTGHSMGGHGVWHVGATFPDRFAAIGPSAGWISFRTYGGPPGAATRPTAPDPFDALLQRAAGPSDTLSLIRNYQDLGVYLLHGSADDNVPPGQARTMQAELARFHRDFQYHEQPGAGHWWDASDEPGADCVDWQPLFDFFSRRALPDPATVREVRFSTASPGVSARCRWATVLTQQQQFAVSTVELRSDPLQRRITGTTRNVARLALDPASLAPGTPLTVVLDGQSLTNLARPAPGEQLYLTRGTGERWAVGPAPSADQKGPERCGPFKDAFRHRMLFVYGTHGAPAENAWALAKARLDAETFWYRGNGSVDVIPDSRFDPAAEPDRSVIVYGNRDTNSAWEALLSESPLQVRRGEVRLGAQVWRGETLACLFVRPRPGSARASVAVVSGSGAVGQRLTDRIPYFVSGVALPDVLVCGPDVLEQGAAGVRATGFFGLDWRVPTGEFATR